jgi:hypothetical protein
LLESGLVAIASEATPPLVTASGDLTGLPSPYT